jgi:multidrug resistance efflux pump
MFWNRWGTAAAFAVLMFGVAGTGGILAAAGPQVKPERRETSAANSAESSRGDHETIVSLMRRVQDLERRLDLLTGERGEAQAMPPPAAERREVATVRKIRPRFDCTIEQVFVKVGQRVRKGDPLAELYSPELATAKSDLSAKYIQWKHDRSSLDLRMKLQERAAISQAELANAQNDERKSQLALLLATERLGVYFDLSRAEVDALLTLTSDFVSSSSGSNPLESNLATAQNAKARYTLRSPVDGQVLSILTQPGDLADKATILMVLQTGPGSFRNEIPRERAETKRDEPAP